MAKYFTGFNGFDCAERIWRGIFKANIAGNSVRLRALMSIPEEFTSGSIFSRKLCGKNTWGADADAFLAYADDETVYREKWLKKWETRPGCRDAFRAFIMSVPNEADEEQRRFMPAAREVSDYLSKALVHGEDDRVWTAAGMYVLIAFFMQNGKTAVPRFYAPPRACDPAREITELSDTPEAVVMTDTRGYFGLNMRDITRVKSVDMAFHAGSDWLTSEAKVMILSALMENGIPVRVVINDKKAIEQIAGIMRNGFRVYMDFDECVGKWRERGAMFGSDLLNVRVSSLPIMHRYYSFHMNDPAEDSVNLRLYTYGNSEMSRNFAKTFDAKSDFFHLYRDEFDYLWQTAR